MSLPIEKYSLWQFLRMNVHFRQLFQQFGLHVITFSYLRHSALIFSLPARRGVIWFSFFHFRNINFPLIWPICTSGWFMRRTRGYIENIPDIPENFQWIHKLTIILFCLNIQKWFVCNSKNLNYFNVYYASLIYRISLIVIAFIMV